ncbi:DS22B phosphatase, partial [Polypterus senegalus]
MKGGDPFYSHPDLLQVLPGNLPPALPCVAEVPAAYLEALQVSLRVFPQALLGVTEVARSRAPKASGHPLAVTMDPYKVELQIPVPVATKGTRVVAPICLAGVSRSVTLVVAYIMTVTNLGWQDSLMAVRAARACAGPNAGFLRQLEEFEKTELHNFRKWLKEEYKENSFKDEEEVQILLSKSCKPIGVDVDICDIMTT